MWAGFTQGALRIINLDSLGDKKYDQSSLCQKNGRAEGQKQAVTALRGAK